MFVPMREREREREKERDREKRMIDTERVMRCMFVPIYLSKGEKEIEKDR